MISFIPPDGKQIFLAGADATIRMLHARSGHVIRVLRGHEGPVLHLRLSPDGRWLASLDAHGQLKLWDPLFDQETVSIPPLQPSFGFTRAGLLAGNPETTNPMIAPSAISLYDPHTGEHRGKALATRLQVRSRSTYGMDAARQLLAHAYVTKGQTRLDVWDWGPERLLRTMEIGPPLAALDRLLWPPAGALLLGTRSGAGFVVWDTQAGRELWRKERGFLHAAAFFPDGERAVLAYGDPPHHSLPAIWNLRTGQVERQLSVPLQQCWGLALSADGTRLALAGIQAYGPEAVLMDLTTSQVLLRLPDVASRGLAFSPDGKRLATSHPRNDSVQLWDTETGRLVLVLGGRREEPVQEVIFSLDGRFLAARGGGDGEINLMRIYDAMPLPGEK